MSTLLFKLGWSGSSPSLWNWFGVILVILGGSLIALALSLHFSHATTGWRFELTPPYLLTAGPYKYTRNPMYLGGISIWLGWTIYYGNPAVLLILLLFTGFVTLFQVPWEERLLEKRFGGEYTRFKKDVPRWLPRVPRES